jgi:hypothetical protein
MPYMNSPMNAIHELVNAIHELTKEMKLAQEDIQ